MWTDPARVDSVRAMLWPAQPPPPPQPPRWELALICLVLVLGAWLRWADLNQMEFKGDEAVAVQLALPMIEGQEIPRVGLMSSVGIHNPPLFIWLVALCSWLSVNPVFVTGALVGTLSLLSIAGAWWFLRRRLGIIPTLGATALYATATWPVLYARKLWAQDVLPLFSLLLLQVLVLTWERKRTRWVAGIPVLLCILWQLHFSALGLILVSLGLLAARFRELHWRALGLGVLASILMMGPYLHFQIEKDYPDVKGFRNIAKGKRADGSARESAKQWTLDPVRLAGTAALATNVDYAMGPAKADYASWQSGFAKSFRTLCDTLAYLLLALGAALAPLLAFRRLWWRRQGRESEPASGLVVVTSAWFLGFIAVFALLRLEHIYPHYFIILYPVPFVLMWLPLAWLAARFQRWGTGAAVAITLLLVLGHLSNLSALRSYIDDRGGTPRDYGVAYVHKAELTDWVVANGLSLHKPPGYEFGFLVRTARRYGDIDEISQRVEQRPAPPRSHRKVRVWDSLRHPRAKSFRCAQKQSFGPLIACPSR